MTMTRFILSICCAALVGASSCLAEEAKETFVWRGPANGAWSESANWEGGRVPTPGSVVVFNADTTVGSATDEQDVDFGEAGLTIRNTNSSANAVNLYVRFSGAGKLVFDGPGRCILKSISTYAGGTEIRKSAIKIIPPQTEQNRNSLGTGPIDISDMAGLSWTTALSCDAWNVSLSNDIRVHGAAPGGHIAVSNPCRLSGAVTGDADLLVISYYGNLTVGGAVTIPDDCTATFRNKVEDSSLSAALSAMRVEGPVAGNLTFEGKRENCLSGTGTVACCTFTAQGMTNVIAASGVWTGTNVVVRGESSTLFLQGSGNLKPYARISVEEGARIDVAQGVKVRVAELRVGGESLPIGIYTAKTLPNVLSGRGRLRVGDPGAVFILR